MTDDLEPSAPVLRLVPPGDYEIKSGAPCRHGALTITERQRRIECKSCGAVVDPFSVVLGYAREERMWRHWDAEARKLRGEIAGLKAEEKRVKARLRRARGKVHPIPAEVAAMRRCVEYLRGFTFGRSASLVAAVDTATREAVEPL